MKKLALFKIRFVSCTDLEGRDLKKKKKSKCQFCPASTPVLNYQPL